MTVRFSSFSPTFVNAISNNLNLFGVSSKMEGLRDQFLSRASADDSRSLAGCHDALLRSGAFPMPSCLQDIRAKLDDGDENKELLKSYYEVLANAVEDRFVPKTSNKLERGSRIDVNVDKLSLSVDFTEEGSVILHFSSDSKIFPEVYLEDNLLDWPLEANREGVYEIKIDPVQILFNPQLLVVGEKNSEAVKLVGRETALPGYLWDLFSGGVDAEGLTLRRQKLIDYEKEGLNFAKEVSEILGESHVEKGVKLDKILQLENRYGVNCLPAKRLTILLNAYKHLGYFNHVARVYEQASSNEFRSSDVIREYYIVALNKLGRLKEAIDAARSYLESGFANGEVLAGLGKTYFLVHQLAANYDRALDRMRDCAEDVRESAWYGRSDKTRLTEIATEAYEAQETARNAFLRFFTDKQLSKARELSRDFLNESQESYRAGFLVDFEYYPGINVLYRLSELERDEGQFYTTLGRLSNKKIPRNFAANASWCDAAEYVARHGLGLPTEAEYEFAGRGPAVDMRQFMEEMRIISARQLIDYLRQDGEPLENAVDTSNGLVLGARLISDIYSPEFKALVESDAPFVMWRGHNTLSGRLTNEEAYYDHKDDGPVAVDEKLRRNGYGLSDMLGGMWEWTGDAYTYTLPIYGLLAGKDTLLLPAKNPFSAPHSKSDSVARVLRGGSFCSHEDLYLFRSEGVFRSAYRNHDTPSARFLDVGFRVAASLAPRDS